MINNEFKELLLSELEMFDCTEKCYACRIERDNVDVKQMPAHTCEKGKKIDHEALKAPVRMIKPVITVKETR